MTKTPSSGSIFKYIYQELTWGQVRFQALQLHLSQKQPSCFTKQKNNEPTRLYLSGYRLKVKFHHLSVHCPKMTIFTKSAVKRFTHLSVPLAKSSRLCFMDCYVAWIFLFHSLRCSHCAVQSMQSKLYCGQLDASSQVRLNLFNSLIGVLNGKFRLLINMRQFLI